MTDGEAASDTLVFVIALPLVFLAGASLSAAYFLMRGRALGVLPL